LSIEGKEKQALIDRLIRARIKELNVAVMRTIISMINKDQGVAFAQFTVYAQKSSVSERTVLRTVKTARDRGILKQAWRPGAPALWAPDLMDMEPEEAARRADLLVAEYQAKRGHAFAKLAESAAPPPSDHHVQGPPSGNVPASAPQTAQEVPTCASELASISTPKMAPDLAPDLAPLKPLRGSNSKIGLSPQGLSPPPPRGGDGQRRRAACGASNAAFELAEEIGRLAGMTGPTFTWPEKFRTPFAANVVQGWLDELGKTLPGLEIPQSPGAFIIAHVRETMKTRRTDLEPIVSIRFFWPPMERTITRLQLSLHELRAARLAGGQR
jgi:hypothetical protein